MQFWNTPGNCKMQVSNIAKPTVVTKLSETLGSYVDGYDKSSGLPCESLTRGVTVVKHTGAACGGNSTCVDIEVDPKNCQKEMNLKLNCATQYVIWP